MSVEQLFRMTSLGILTTSPLKKKAIVLIKAHLISCPLFPLLFPPLVPLHVTTPSFLS